jgi:hypothetical protein
MFVIQLHDWYIHLSRNFHIENSAFADPKNIPMGQEIQRKRKEPTERRTAERFPMLVPKTDPGGLYVTPGSAIITL